jgi:hypothetical protein
MFKKQKVGISGRVKWIVRDQNGDAKRYQRNFIQKLFGHPEFMDWSNNNIVTDVGDALIADQAQETPEKTKLDEANAVIGVGTGYTEEVKGSDALETQVGSDEAMDTNYPQTKGAWAAGDDNVIVYVSTFEAGDVTSADLDEAILTNGSETMAYAEITPKITVGADDTLEITWEITFLGS